MGPRKRGRVGAGLLVALLTVTGCGMVPTLPGPGSCPEGWRAAVLWSTENGWFSELAYVTQGGIERRLLPQQGFVPSPGSLLSRSGTEILLGSNGNTVRNKTHLVRLSSTTCTVQAEQIPEQLLLAVALADGFSYTTHAFFHTGAELRRRDATGAVTAHAQFPEFVLDVLLPHGDALYALGGVPGGDSVLLVLDAVTLAERSRVVLRDVTSVGGSAVIKNGKLYYGQTVVPGDREGTGLGIVDLTTWKHTTVDLGSPAPFLILDGGDRLYIGHTFINPAFRPMSEYRWISRFDPVTGRVERFDVGIGIDDLAIKDQQLLVLNSSEDEELATLRAFDLPSMTRHGDDVTIGPPAGFHHHYVSSLITP